MILTSKFHAQNINCLSFWAVFDGHAVGLTGDSCEIGDQSADLASGVCAQAVSDNVELIGRLLVVALCHATKHKH